MARSAVLALALLASAYAAEEVCAEGQCAEGAEEAALLQSTAAQKLTEVKAHSNATADKVSCAGGSQAAPLLPKDCDGTNCCYHDDSCSPNGGHGCNAMNIPKCRFCNGPGYAGVPKCTCRGGPKAALPQSTAAQKLTEVKAHSNDTCTATCGAVAATTCCDGINKCYYDPDCPSVSHCTAGGAPQCRFCDCSGCPTCPTATPAPTSAPTPSIPCDTKPAYVCGDSINQCYLDKGCKPPTSLTGCNAGGHQLCRFCKGTNCH